MTRTALFPTLLLLVLVACRTSETEQGGAAAKAGETLAAEDRAAHLASLPAPLRLEGKAYDAAGTTPLPARAPEELHGIENLFRLSANIVSGSEPQDEESLRALAAMGIRTIVSVDGKLPDDELAAELGMRYVHVPIQYRGIKEDELLRLSKTFRELEGTLYVHCFHGKHRGPAAAAVGRLVVDGVSREVALAEMRQYCGTAEKYEGLYRTVALQAVPSAEATAAFEYAFESRHRVDDLVDAMCAMGRANDNLILAQKAGWQAVEDHPDLDATNEARKVAEALEAIWKLDSTAKADSSFRSWMRDSVQEARALVAELEGSAGSEVRPNERFERLQALCSDCHRSYRNR